MDCRWVDQCQAYHAVERQHGVAHLTAAPAFTPQDPRIHVQVLDLEDGQVGVEWDVRACSSFELERGRWRRLCPDQVVPT
ncbi:MAG: hypothetical protein RLZZ255_71 [Cyanobacteriota bacterium]